MSTGRRLVRRTRESERKGGTDGPPLDEWTFLSLVLSGETSESLVRQSLLTNKGNYVND